MYERKLSKILMAFDYGALPGLHTHIIYTTHNYMHKFATPQHWNALQLKKLFKYFNVFMGIL